MNYNGRRRRTTEGPPRHWPPKTPHPGSCPHPQKTSWTQQLKAAKPAQASSCDPATAPTPGPSQEAPAQLAHPETVSKEDTGTSFGEETGPAWHASRPMWAVFVRLWCHPTRGTGQRTTAEEKGRKDDLGHVQRPAEASRAGWAEGRKAAGQGTRLLPPLPRG